MPVDVDAFDQTLNNARRTLLQARSPDGHWEGELSSSALSTATAVFALALDPSRTDAHPFIQRGIDWLVAHQNSDGGWGDTVKSCSNISTTALCWAALSYWEDASKGNVPPFRRDSQRSAFSPPDEKSAPLRVAAKRDVTAAIARCESWLSERAGGIAPNQLIPAIIARYGKDGTFSVPILTTCALAGRFGAGRDAWKHIPQLPFELAAFPQRWFKWLRLPVVSYALPALIAIGLVRHRHRPTRNPAARAARRLAHSRAMRLLKKIQPTSGGFLEATPLTSFVVMSLIGAGLADHPVVHRGIEFLLRSARPDGSWPIDTNLATWVTTLSVNALATDPDFNQFLQESERIRIRDWLLSQQYRTEHPYTLADPGCWAWTDLTGGVPDADDTPGALLALQNLGPADEMTSDAAHAGVQWLLNLQNRDGGIPTFCRGWGKLPFDRSSADLTAHAIRAWKAWDTTDRAAHARQRAIDYLIRTQRPDGAWVPLWFGNQHVPDDLNPTYGTSRVLRIGIDGHSLDWQEAVSRGVMWLLSAQNPDGGWGGDAGAPSSIEETALAVEALAFIARLEEIQRVDDAITRGVNWLIDHTCKGTEFDPSPIGFYFAKLWYYEKLYPVIFTVAALNAAKRARIIGGSHAPHPSPLETSSNA